MALFFPNINGNLILTQLPYVSMPAYETVSQDMETGVRFSFPRRGNVNITNNSYVSYPTRALGRFSINYSVITDSEVAVLQNFFNQVAGKYGYFSFLDPDGNLLLWSENYTQSYWAKTGVTVTVNGGVTDPYGGSLASYLTAGSGDSWMEGLVGPSTGGMQGYVFCVSAWVMALSANQQMFIGFVDSASARDGTTWSLPQNVWKRIFYTSVRQNNNSFSAILRSGGTWNSRTIALWGIQVAPTKGESAYKRTHGGYFGYHQYVRLDTDQIQVRVVGPDQNSVALPCFEFQVDPSL